MVWNCLPGPTSARRGLVARLPGVDELAASSTCRVSPFTLESPFVAVTAIVAAPEARLCGTVNTIRVSDHEVAETVCPPTRSVPGAAPNPLPLIVTTRLSPAVFFRTYGRSTASSCGWLLARSHTVGLATVVSGANAVAATCVGASSVTVYRPGHPWKLVAIVRNLGL